ncbi:MAG: glycogen synthase GlgA [Cyanobacteria bacterium J06621_11]
MFIVQIASECAPVIKAGGLGDVVYGLSREIDQRDHTVEVILPKYDCMRYDHVWGMHKAYENLYVPWDGGQVHCTVDCGWVHGQLCFFIEPHSYENFFSRGKYYGEWDDQIRFAFFSKAALEFLLKSGKRPDVIHCHDWQTGLIPVMLFEIYKHHGMANQRICYSIHNFKHQGVWSTDILRQVGLNREVYYSSRERLGDNNNAGSINFMKGGIVYANYVNTVSPHHAWEARFSDIGCGLQPTLEAHQDRFGGILNGLSYDVWNPETDEQLPANYGISDFESKERNKKALRERMLLASNDKPIVAFIGRLDQQKGVHQVHHGLYYSLANDAQFVLLGSASEPGLNDWFWHEKIHLNDNPDCHLEIGYNEELAHLIYAAADIMIVPSNYEPCGLTQIISLKYGTVPVVRGVGGLVNTIFDVDYDQDKPPEERNGFVFYENDSYALESALGRALNLYHQKPEEFARLAKRGMDCDYSWKKPGDQYVGVYEYIRA